MNLRRFFVLVAVATALSTAVGILAAPARADLIGGLLSPVLPQCGPALHPFTKLGDSGAYYAIPNNGFEVGSTGWKLSGGARVVSGNEKYYVNGYGRYSLSLPSGSSAESPPTCINLLAPYARFLAMDADGSDRGLAVQVIFHGLTGNITGLLNYGTLSPGPYGDWALSGLIRSALALPLGTSYATFKFAPQGNGSAWRIDDVFVDPWLDGVV